MFAFFFFISLSFSISSLKMSFSSVVTKSVLDVVTFAHVSEVWKTHDIFAGVTGASSSLIDLFC